MADNYLENKMIDYINAGRSAKAEPPQAESFGAKSRRGGSEISFNVECRHRRRPRHRRAVVRAFANAGCQVAFCDIDAKAGTELAQQSGTRFYPVDVTQPLQLQNALNDMATHWGNIDIAVNCVASPS